MNELDRYPQQYVERGISPFESPPEISEGTTSSLLAGILRYWYIAILVFTIICVVGLPSIWFFIKPKYEVIGAIRVAQITPDILTGQPDRGEVASFQSYMNTQAELILSPQVVQRVADEIADKNLSFFSNGSEDDTNESSINNTEPDIAMILKNAVAARTIIAVPSRGSELMKIIMLSRNAEDAKTIVNAFLQAYMLVEVVNSAQGQDQKITLLENERKMLSEKLLRQRDAIRQMADEYGTSALESRQDMMLQRVSTLLGELTKAEASRIVLEARLQAIKQSSQQQGIMTESMRQKRNEYVNTDLTVQELTRSIVRLEQDLIAARQLLTSNNPVLKQKEEFISAFKDRLEERRQEVAKEFEMRLPEEVNETAHARLASMEAELEHTKIYEKQLRDIMAEEDTKTIELGRKHLTIQDMQYQLNLDKEMYDTITRRIQGLEMERKRPARISIAYPAGVARVRDKRAKFSMALVFSALGCGLLGAFVRDKADVSLHTPEDVIKRIGIRIIGTTTSPRTIETSLLPKQIAEDYQTIRANLGLIDGGGLPKKIVITGPSIRDGKTTFACNLATSLARSGKKILLIDGDFRKPDIGRLLNVPRESRCLQDALVENKIERAVSTAASAGLDVLAADSQSLLAPYELLTSPQTAEQIERLSRKYDHVIIDTPPVLAFPDALIWAKLAGAVILTGFAGHTAVPDLKETNQRLAEIGVRILGTVLSNVPANHSYYRYGYDYYSQSGHSARNNKNSRERPLLLDNPDKKISDDSIS